MKDKGTEVFLALVFGMLGVSILILAWVQPMAVSERIMTTFVGSIGLFVAFIRSLSSRSKANKNRGNVKTEVEIKNESNQSVLSRSA